MPPPSPGRKLKTFTEVPRDLWSRKPVRDYRGAVRGTSGTLIVGDDTGLIKVLSVKRKGHVIRIWGEQNANKRIQRLYWNTELKEHYTLPNSDQLLVEREKEFLAVLSNGDIELYDTKSGAHRTVIRAERDIMG